MSRHHTLKYEVLPEYCRCPIAYHAAVNKSCQLQTDLRETIVRIPACTFCLLQMTQIYIFFYYSPDSSAVNAIDYS